MYCHKTYGHIGWKKRSRYRGNQNRIISRPVAITICDSRRTSKAFITIR